MALKKPLINYTNRDFDSIRQDLDNYAKKYYSTRLDRNASSFTSMYLDFVSYIGDMLSFYLDYQANEMFFDSATEYESVLRMAKQRGFKFRTNPSSFGTATFYVKVPANTYGAGPNTSYIPILRRGSEFSTPSGKVFTLTEDVDFADSNNEIRVADVNSVTGIPTYYAIRAYGEVISGRIFQYNYTVGDFEEFLKIKLPEQYVTEVISVVDSENNEYYEVDYLSQNIIYKSIQNQDFQTDGVPFILKTYFAARRFIVDRVDKDTYIQFGHGSESILESNSITDPSNVILNRHGRDYETNLTFDPKKLIENDKFGIAPENTVIKVKYRVNTFEDANADVNEISNVLSPILNFNSETTLSTTTKFNVLNSLEVSNDSSITGDITFPTIDELKTRVFDFFASQNRAVTADDYKSIVYMMPDKYGAVKRCSILQDDNSIRRNLKLYVISENSLGKLTTTNSVIKQNIKTWLTNYKMINDKIDIYDANIINFGIEFSAIGNIEFGSPDEILVNAISKLKEEYIIKFEIGEPIFITTVYNILNKMEEISDVRYVKITKIDGSDYSSYNYNFENNMSDDGRYIKIPSNAIAELKYPDEDIKGTIL